MSEEQRPLTREEWRQLVKEAGGREEFIKKEMIRLGFWIERPLTPEEQEQAEREEAELKQLEAELAELQQRLQQIPNLKQLLKEARQQRIEESRRRREERRKAREQAREEARKRWEEYKAAHVVHVGEGYSAGLNHDTYDEGKLIQLGIPLIRSALELAEVMGISLSKLKWLTYHRNAATLCHYYRFTIPKKSGGEREISAPKAELRQAQAWIKENILEKLPVHPSAYGFVPGRSTLDNAKPHLRQEIVIKMDLKDFFPTIHFWRVRGLFQSFGYSEAVSTLFALLCTEPPRKEVEFDGKYYYVAMGERQLPQGACTSPAITNLICRRLDEKLTRLAEANGFVYTRYADDLTFSCGKDKAHRIGYLMKTVRAIVRFEGFEVNEEKTRVLRSSRRQKVTGIVVNEKPNISRKELRRFRAILHNVEKHGLEAENRFNHPNFWSYIQGYASYVSMVRPDLGKKFAMQIERIAEKYSLPTTTKVS